MTGRGFSFGHYSNTPTAGIVEIEVNKKTGKITVKHVYGAIDPGYVVYPDGLHSNEEGAAMQGVSRALHEQVAFNSKEVTSVDWVTYPILRFKDAPTVTLKALSRTTSRHRPAAAPARRRRRARARPGSGRDRQRVLRRHGCPHPRGADDAGPRPQLAQGGRPVAPARPFRGALRRRGREGIRAVGELHDDVTAARRARRREPSPHP